jgi:hypothetical protein
MILNIERLHWHGKETTLDVFFGKYDKTPDVMYKNPCLMRLFSEFPSMVTTDRYDCIDGLNKKLHIV